MNRILITGKRDKVYHGFISITIGRMIISLLNDLRKDTPPPVLYFHSSLVLHIRCHTCNMGKHAIKPFTISSIKAYRVYVISISGFSTVRIVPITST
jgi:hypothetical protein